MNRILCLTLGFALCLSACSLWAEDFKNVKPDMLEKVKAALPTEAPAKPKQARKVLIFSKTNGFRHSSIAVGAAAVQLMGEKTGAYSAMHTEDDSVFEPDSLKEYDAVIMVNTTGNLFQSKEKPKDDADKKAQLEREERLKQSLVQFVRGGKGLAGTHSATDTYGGWKEYNDMMGGAFAGHPWHEKVPVKVLVPDHPVNRAFGGKNFEITDEIYQFRQDTNSPTARRMLLSLDPSWEGVKKGNRPDGNIYVSWVSLYGGGRTFYCSLGHREEIYYNPTILQHYLAGFQFVLGDLDVDASPTTVAEAKP